MEEAQDYVNPRRPKDINRDRCNDEKSCKIFIFADKCIIICGEEED